MAYHLSPSRVTYMLPEVSATAGGVVVLYRLFFIQHCGIPYLKMASF